MAEEEIKIDLLGLGIFDENTTVGYIRKIFDQGSETGGTEMSQDENDLLQDIQEKAKNNETLSLKEKIILRKRIWKARDIIKDKSNILKPYVDALMALLLFEDSKTYWENYYSLNTGNGIDEKAAVIFDGKGSIIKTVFGEIIKERKEKEGFFLFPFDGEKNTLGDVYSNLKKEGWSEKDPAKFFKYKSKWETILNFFKLEKFETTYKTKRTEDKSMQSTIEEIIDLIETGGIRQIIFTGAPGTGKTYIAKKIAEEKGSELTWENKKNGEHSKYEFVQFHPSYDYTDFVEGIRPISTNGTISFVKMDGIFKRFCRKIIENENSNPSENRKLYFFIIDEINRADLAKVFGELMYCLEKDKRGENNRVKTQYHNLPTYDVEKENENGDYIEKKDDVFADGFYIPENVVIIGTMNDIDRSVESMDFALRRRFEWCEFKVDKVMLENAFKECDENNRPIFGKVIQQYAGAIASGVKAMNDVIEKQEGLNKQYFISQGQFANIPNEEPDSEINVEKLDELLDYILDYRISTLLREYVRGEDEPSVDTFIRDCKNAFIEAIEADLGSEDDEDEANEAGEDETYKEDKGDN